MTTFSSVPLNPAQPAKKFYPISALQQYTGYTYRSFIDAWGYPPPFDPNKFGGMVKNWADTTGNVQISVLVPRMVAGKATLVALTMTADDAATINIPPYWPYEWNASTPAGPGTQGQPAPPVVETPVRPLMANETFDNWWAYFIWFEVMRTDL